MANESLRLSDAGWAELRRRESAVMAYYNDQANNCTYGIGTLAHTGPCTRKNCARRLRRRKSMHNSRSGSVGRKPPCDDMYRFGN